MLLIIILIQPHLVRTVFYGNCELIIDIEYSYYKRFYQYQRDRTHQFVDLAIQKINQQLPLNISLVGYNLLEFNQRIQGGKYNMIEKYGAFLVNYNRTKYSNNKYKNPNEYCLNLLLTHRKKADMTSFGVAYISSENNIGGICCLKPFKGIQRNILAINTIANFPSVFTTQIIHEIGHSVGAEHDCCLDYICSKCHTSKDKKIRNCLSLDNPYVMYVGGDSYGINSYLYSQCSLNQIEYNLRKLKKENCLV